MLNSQQIIIINRVISPLLDEISALTDPCTILRALESIVSEQSAIEHLPWLMQEEIGPAIESIRDIMLHPYPHHRSVSDDIPCEEDFVSYRIKADQFDSMIDTQQSSDEFVVFKNGKTLTLFSIHSYSADEKLFCGVESKGLLGLTIHDDANTPAVTRQDVISHIVSLIDKRIETLQHKHLLPEAEVHGLPEHDLYGYCQLIAVIAPTQCAALLAQPVVYDKLGDLRYALLLRNNRTLARTLYSCPHLGPYSLHEVHSQAKLHLIDSKHIIDYQPMTRDVQSAAAQQATNPAMTARLFAAFNTLSVMSPGHCVRWLASQSVFNHMNDYMLAILIKGNPAFARALFEHPHVRQKLQRYTLLEMILTTCKTHPEFSEELLKDSRCLQTLGPDFLRIVCRASPMLALCLFTHYDAKLDVTVLLTIYRIFSATSSMHCASFINIASIAKKLEPYQAAMLAENPAMASLLAFRQEKILTLDELKLLPSDELKIYCYHRHDTKRDVCLPIMVDASLRDRLSPDVQNVLLRRMPSIAEALHAHGISLLIKLHPRVLYQVCIVTAATKPAISISILTSGLRNRLSTGEIASIIERNKMIALELFNQGVSFLGKLDALPLMSICMNTPHNISIAILSNEVLFEILMAKDECLKHIYLSHPAIAEHFRQDAPAHLHVFIQRMNNENERRVRLPKRKEPDSPSFSGVTATRLG